MKILLSNDDGLLATGIGVLTEYLSKEHDVYIVAPDRERSASGHSLTLHTPLRVQEVNAIHGAKRCWMTSGTPGDCVKLALKAILSEDEMPDLVISGINHGPNLGGDILYSGTVSCAIEGAMLGFQSIAVSLDSWSSECDDYQVAGEFMLKLIKKLEHYRIPEKTILNINIPAIEKEDIVDVVVTELGERVYTDKYEKRIDPRGKTYYWLAGELITELRDANTDISAIRNNMISITPLTYDMTRKDYMIRLDDELCCGLKTWF